MFQTPLPPLHSSIRNLFILLSAATTFSATSGCTAGKGGKGVSSLRAEPSKISEASAADMDYVRAFSREQQKCLRDVRESTPHWGAHEEALDYGDFLNEKAPRILQIVEQSLPAKQRAQFQKSKPAVEAQVDAAEKRNEEDAADNEGGTLAKMIRHHGRMIAMKVRIASLAQWIPHLPSKLQPEIQAICERTQNH